MKGALATLAAAALAFVAAAPAASAMKIEKIVTPAGITAWLAREHSVPLVALNYAFRGGSSQDEADKAGTANLTSDLLDEGAGELNSEAFHRRLERHAIDMSFRVGRDYFRGTLRTLKEHRDEAFGLLGLALTKPHFDADAVQRVRGQVMSVLRRELTNPNDLASHRWWRAAFPDHPYGRQTSGSLETVPRITADDMRAYVHHVFARDDLTVSIVGDIDAKEAARLVDRAFGSLPAKGQLKRVPPAAPASLGQRIVVNVNVPQAVVTFGGQGIARSDPDFMAAYIVNHILGGGDFTSRLYQQVREKRGLAYGVYTALIWFRHAAVMLGTTATRADRTADALRVIERQIRLMAEKGPTAQELAAAKSYLKGAYALSLDSSTKIAAQLTEIQLDNLGIDYIQRRSGMIDKVTLADATRVAKRLYGDGLLVVVAGRPKGLTSGLVPERSIPPGQENSSPSAKPSHAHEPK
jgi:zinc protease